MAKLPKGELKAQCPDCKAIEIDTDSGPKWQQTFVVFNNLPKKTCYGCQKQKGGAD